MSFEFRTLQNRPGTEFDPEKVYTLFAEDYNELVQLVLAQSIEKHYLPLLTGNSISFLNGVTARLVPYASTSVGTGMQRHFVAPKSGRITDLSVRNNASLGSAGNFNFAIYIDDTPTSSVSISSNSSPNFHLLPFATPIEFEAGQRIMIFAHNQSGATVDIYGLTLHVEYDN